jgi:hypothetical protein
MNMRRTAIGALNVPVKLALINVAISAKITLGDFSSHCDGHITS